MVLLILREVSDAPRRVVDEGVFLTPDDEDAPSKLGSAGTTAFPIFRVSEMPKESILCPAVLLHI